MADDILTKDQERLAKLWDAYEEQEREFNLAAGMSNKDDRLPDYFQKEQLAPHNITFEVTDEDLDKVHNY